MSGIVQRALNALDHLVSKGAVPDPAPGSKDVPMRPAVGSGAAQRALAQLEKLERQHREGQGDGED